MAIPVPSGEDVTASAGPSRKRVATARLCALVPIAAFAVLAWTFAAASSQGLDWLDACSGPPRLTSCETSPDAWLFGSLLWSVLAAALTSLLLMEIVLSSRSKLRALPAQPIGVVAIGNLVLGLALVPIGELTSYGRFPTAIDSAGIFLFVTLGLLLWGLGLLSHGTAARPHATLVLVVTTVGGVAATVLAVAESWAVLNPPIM